MAESKYQFTELQEKWLKALESGDYAQCTHTLHDGSGYCCLGVACVTAGVAPAFEDATYDDEGCIETPSRFVFNGEWEVPPDSLVEMLKLRGPLGELSGGTIAGADKLAFANDQGATFAEIAAFIRANPEKVFLP